MQIFINKIFLRQKITATKPILNTCGRDMFGILKRHASISVVIILNISLNNNKKILTFVSFLDFLDKQKKIT